MATPTVKEIRDSIDEISHHDSTGMIVFKITDTLRMIVDHLEALEKQNGEDHG